MNLKTQVPSDLPVHGQFVASSNLKSQLYLNKLNEWSNNHQMIISQKKTKAMIFNFTENYQFTTRLTLKGENIEIVDKLKLLGTTIINDLSWDENFSLLIKR